MNDQIVCEGQQAAIEQAFREAEARVSKERGVRGTLRRIGRWLMLPWRILRVWRMAPVLLYLLREVPEEVWANDVEFSGMNEGVEQVRSIMAELRILVGR